MTLRDLIEESGLPPLDAELLAALALAKDPSWITAHDDTEPSPDTEKKLRELFARRASGEPVAYITGQKEFYGRTFTVTKATLVPRPATEALIGLTKEFLDGKTPANREIDSDISAYVLRLSDGEIDAVFDIGTGSGNIAITLALEGVKEHIIGVDISQTALDIAEINRKRLGAEGIQWTRKNGTDVVRNFHRPFLIVSNPPYIPEGIPLEPTVENFEPAIALRAGKKGMDVTLPLLRAALGNPQCRGVILELRTDQLPLVEAIRSEVLG